MRKQQWAMNAKHWRKLPAWQLTKVRNKEVIDEARKEGKTVRFASLMDICHLKNSELDPKFQKYKGRVVLRGDIVKDDSGSHAVHRARFICVTNDGGKSDGCHRKTTRMRRTSSRRSISLHPSQHGRCTIDVKKFHSQNVQILKHKWPKSWAGIGRPRLSSWAKSVRSSSGRTIMGKTIRESSIFSRVLGKSSKIGNAFF